jgi:YidC/Oxa1 family membrane protein insertase
MFAFAPLSSAVDVAYSVVSALAFLTAPVGGTAAAIVLFTLAVRTVLLPLSIARVRGERRRAALLPKVYEIQRRYAKDPARVSAELAALYRSERTSPFAGCLPALAQVPFFVVTYRLFVSPSVAGHANRLLTDGLLGVPLGQHFLAGPHPVFFVLFAVLGLLAWWFSRRMAVVDGGTRTAPAITAIMKLMPYGTVLAAAAVPLAAGLYLATSTAWTALETALLPRLIGAG